MNRIIVAATLLVLTTSECCFANNNLFLPGDAYFPTELTQQDIDALRAKIAGDRQFKYSDFGGYEGAFCGYAGYLNAKIPAVNEKFAKNLADVCALVRKSEPARTQGKNADKTGEADPIDGVRVLFYPRDFDFPKYVLGLRYNENWAEECVKFGHRRQDLRLCSLIADPDAVERDWRDAKDVPALVAKLPDVKLATVPETTAPVVIPGAVKAIVIGSYSLKELFKLDDFDMQLAEHDDRKIYVVDSNGITTIVHHKGNWKSEEFEPALKK